MSHSTKINDTTFIHNGDYSGSVTISRDHVCGEECMEVPFKDLLKFIGSYVISEKISRLEQMDADEIFGLKIERKRGKR